jgi:predicted Zn finger-like uncharacterized protein
MTSYVSRCPSCDTSFKVNDAQLDAANGAVRCGACLQVFVASDYFVEAPIPDLFAEDSIAFSEPSSEEVEAAEIVAVASADVAEVEVAEVVEVINVVDVVEASADTEQQSEIDSETGMSTGHSLGEQPQDVQSEIIDEHLSNDVTAELSAIEISENLDGIANAAPEDLVGELMPVSDRRTGRWAAGCVLAVVVLGAQYLWFERDVLAMDVRLRPYYLSVCNIVNCQLPDYLDAANLVATDLVVRTHPATENGLIVDAILRNGAPYRQRFPPLQLRFSDINGNTLAERTFSPDAYLAGELAGLRYIPAVTEVRFSLDIVDPGPLAVSYSMRAVIN